MATDPTTARLSVVTIGCHDFDAMRAFYAALGWEDAHPPGSATASDGWTSFRTAGGILALWGEVLLAREAGFDAPPAPHAGFRGVTLAANLASEAAVDALLERARAAGGDVRPATKRDWGGFSGYFLDPEGNAWEVAHAPNVEFDERGALIEL